MKEDLRAGVSADTPISGVTARVGGPGNTAQESGRSLGGESAGGRRQAPLQPPFPALSDSRSLHRMRKEKPEKLEAAFIRSFVLPRLGPFETRGG